MILLAVFIVVLAAILEARSLRDGLGSIREDFGPDSALVDPDEAFCLVYSLRNRSPRFALFLRLTEDLPPAFRPLRSTHVVRMQMGGEQVSLTTWLRPWQEARFQIPVSVSRRGFYILPPMELFGGDFLGLREQSRRFNQYRCLTVAPREAEDQGLADVLGGFLGDISVRRFLHEDPVLTAGYRAYTGREPMKSISWTQSARGLGLMVKKYDFTSEPSVSVLLNADAPKSPEHNERMERCFSLARTVCRVLEERGIEYDLATNAMAAEAFSDVADLGAGLGGQHFTAVLERLGRADCRAAYSGERLLERSAASNSDRGRILITPGEEFGDSPALARLRELTGGNVLILRASEVGAP